MILGMVFRSELLSCWVELFGNGNIDFDSNDDAKSLSWEVKLLL